MRPVFGAFAMAQPPFFLAQPDRIYYNVYVLDSHRHKQGPQARTGF